MFATSVFWKAKDRRAPGLGLIAADPLEDADAVVKRVREHMNLGIIPVDEPPVHPDLLGFLHVSLPGASTANEITRPSQTAANGPQ